jgi:cytochrome c oxidase assembly protein subunit 11
MSEAVAPQPPPRTSNGRMALILVGVFALMVGAAYASVPLYKAFCQMTGFGGTVRKAEVAPTVVLNQSIDVRFDANVRGLPWDFRADQVSQTVKIGATGLAFFKVTNNGAKAWTGRASYNVVPESAGAYFQKLECFCFSDQTIQPGQTVDFPVVYFVDPGFAKDEDTKDKREITLSYTFFPTADQSAAQAKTTGSARASEQTTASKPLASAPPLGGTQAARL